MSGPRTSDGASGGAPLPSDPHSRARTRRRVLVAAASVAAAVLVLYAVGAFLIVPLNQPGSPSSMVPIGTVLNFGSATLTVCPAGRTFASVGCVGGDYLYAVNITGASIALGAFGLIVANGSGVVWTGDSNAGMTLIDAHDSILAQFATFGGPMRESSNWVYENSTSASTQLSTSDALLLDMGRSSPAGLGLTLSAFPLGDDGYTGTTSPTSLG